MRSLPRSERNTETNKQFKSKKTAERRFLLLRKLFAVALFEGDAPVEHQMLR